MKNRATNLLALVMLLTSFIALGGCATTTELNHANETANKAEVTANKALQKAIEAERIANEAKTSCEKCSRMFQKSLQK